MKREHILGGVITGAALALIANVLLFGSLFADGRTEFTMLIVAGLALLLSIALVGMTVLVRPTETPMLRAPTGRHLRKVA